MTYARFEDVPAWQEAVYFQISNPNELLERLPPDHPLRKRSRQV
jgi:hypothetical protein